MSGHDWEVNSIEFSNNGKFIASGSGDETIKLWDIYKFECIKTFRGHKDEICSVNFSNDD